MKKILIAYGALILLVIVLAFIKFKGGNILPSFGEKQAVIDNHTFTLLIANDDKSRQVGLSGRKFLDKNTGMLFIFPEKGKYNFWMKNMLFPLDLIYIDDSTIVDIIKNAPPLNNSDKAPTIYTPKKAANYVLEINGGLSDEYKFKIGDKVTLKGIK